MKRALPVKAAPAVQRVRIVRKRVVRKIPAPPPLKLRHYKHVYWMTGSGPMATAYRAVVVHDGCTGCRVCEGTTDWFMEFARVARALLGINLRDCLHWGPLHDTPRPLIAPASNLDVCDRATLRRLHDAYYRLPELERPRLESGPEPCKGLTQAQRFDISLLILARMVQLWEEGQYIGWPT
jgi:hypothetical protein